MLPSDVAIFLATEPVDLRGGFDRLSGIVTETLRGDPRVGSLFVFTNRRRTHAKVLFFDRTGYCILYKRLDRGTFQLPTVIEPGAHSVPVSSEQLALLLQGIDLPDPPRAARASKKNTRRVH